MTTAVSRRDFLKVSTTLGGALVLEFAIPLPVFARTDDAPEITAWIVIHPDGRVVIRIARSEMGQGTMTALAQLVAEELDCDWSKVGTEFASPRENYLRHDVWGSMLTGGSMGVRTSQDYVRRAGARARHMLIAAAAARWQVPASQCSAVNSVIRHRPSGRTLRYGEVAAEAARQKPPKRVKLRDPKDWKIAGQPEHRLDIPDKVLGKPVFGVDAALPGMLHASIVLCPVFGGRVKHVDGREALKMRGVKKVVQQEDFVAVVADNWWRANNALGKLDIEWDTGGNESTDDETVWSMLKAGLEASSLPLARDMGDVDKGLHEAARVIEAEYRSPYLSHATMEPQTCTALLKPDFLDVWTSTQDGMGSLRAAAEAAGLPMGKVEVHKMMLGGGFGRRAVTQDFVRQGVLIAKAMPGVPVKLMWSREQDMRHDYYRPASIVRIKAGLDKQGRLLALHTRIACPSILKSQLPSMMKDGIDFTAVSSFNDMPYAVTHQRVEYAMRNGPVPVGFWRGPGQQNAYYRECFLDELATATGRDPVEFRRAMLAPKDKNRLVLEAVVKAAGWGKPLPKGIHRGVAVANGFGSYAATVAEVSVDRDGLPKVHRIVVAIDSGYVVNPDTCRAQAESNVIYGLGPVLYQAIHIKKGGVVESNFNGFRLPQISEMPEVETVLAPTGGFWGGHGEPAILPLAPAVCNAIFAATGKRLRTLPLNPHDLRSV